MQFTARQIAGMVNGTIEGNPETMVTRLSKIEEGEPGSLSFLSNPLYTPHIYNTEASIVIVNNSFVADRPIKATLVRVEAADIAFAKLLEFYNQIKYDRSGISKLSAISETARLGEKVYAGEFVVIGDNVTIGNNVKLYPHVFIDNNSTIGDNTVLFSGVKVYSDNIIGKNCTLHAGTIIGSDGFRFNQKDGKNIKVPQIGNVIIEDDVEMGANCTIDRATFGSTIIRKGVKFDNQVHVAHYMGAEPGAVHFVGKQHFLAAQGRHRHSRIQAFKYRGESLIRVRQLFPNALGLGDVSHRRHPAGLLAARVNQGRHVHARVKNAAVLAFDPHFKAAGC
jgi:UDP-3-O-[3-hydroxymyristoyl] glucosamine N-acyltransferase